MTRGAVPAEQQVDTSEMVVIHRAFRREARLLAELIAAVPDGDRTRAGVLADHVRWYRAGLHNHHEGEDELLWPILRERVDVRPVVTRMADQHEQIAAGLGRIMAVLPAWQEGAGPAARDRLVAALITHRGVLEQHLDDEEVELLPLAARHLRQAEWNALGEHFVRTTPKSQLLIFLGAVLEDAAPAEQRALLAAMPLAARLVWRFAGRRLYARRVRRVRGRRTRP